MTIIWYFTFQWSIQFITTHLPTPHCVVIFQHFLNEETKIYSNLHSKKFSQHQIILHTMFWNFTFIASLIQILSIMATMAFCISDWFYFNKMKAPYFDNYRLSLIPFTRLITSIDTFMSKWIWEIEYYLSIAGLPCNVSDIIILVTQKNNVININFFISM